MLSKQGPDSAQVTVLMHVDDLFITSKRINNRASFEECMRNKYEEIKINNIVKVAESIDMTFDSVIPGQVSITMDNCERSILFECGVWPLRATLATSTLFDIRDAPKATYEEVTFLIRTFVADLLYVAIKGDTRILSRSGCTYH